MASPAKLAHVVLQTSKLEEMRDWYCAVLKGHVVYERHGLSFVTFDKEHHRVAFISPPETLEPKSPAAAGLHHVAYTFEALDDLLDRYTDLKSQGIDPQVSVQHGITTSIYYRDLDGNSVELQIDNFPDVAGAASYMTGPEFDEDPVGVCFDPDKMIDARRAGASVDELITRKWALTRKSSVARAGDHAPGNDRCVDRAAVALDVVVRRRFRRSPLSRRGSGSSGR